MAEKPNPVTLGERFTQIVGISDSAGNIINPASGTDTAAIVSELETINTSIQNAGTGQINKVNGTFPGTLFGDNFITAQRIPSLSGRWSQGIPAQGFDIYVVGDAYWQVIEPSPGVFDGSIECMTGVNPASEFFATTKKLNRYQDGIQSYFTGTFSFENIQNANGGFEILVGAMRRGYLSLNQFDEIEDGQVFGYVRTNGVIKRVFRSYKNFAYFEVEIPDENWFVDDSHLTIFTIRQGYLGIHPFILEAVDVTTGQIRRIFEYVYESSLTSVHDPNLAFGVFLKNNGNTVNIGIRDASINFGNIGIPRTSFDSSARRAISTQNIASVAAGTNIIATYTVPEFANMVKRIAAAGNTTGSFRITQSNQLLGIQAAGLSNKPAKIEVYLAPKANQTGATYTALNAGFNVIQRATGAAIGTVTLTGATLIKSYIFNSGNTPLPVNEDVSDENFLLDSNLIGIVVIVNTQTVTDLEVIIETQDLF